MQKRDPPDELSGLLFARKSFSVSIFDAPDITVKQVERMLFGEELDPLEYGRLVGAPDGSTVQVFPGETGKYLTITVDNEIFYAETQVRRVALLAERLVVYNDNFVLFEDAPVGIGTRVFARQVAVAHRLGVTKILATVSGSANDPDYNGYYTWVRLGFNCELSGGLKARLKTEGFGDVSDTNELMSIPGGSDWWRDNGVQSRVFFDVSPDSPMRGILEQYLKENEVQPYD